MSNDKDLDTTIAMLNEIIVKPAYSSDINSDTKIKSADYSVLNDLAKSIRVIIKNSQKDVKPQHST